MSDAGLLRAKPLIEQLRQTTDELRHVRDQFGPIYVYYFPQGWLKWLVFMLGLTGKRDFARHLSELQDLRSEAWRLVERARALFEELATCDIEQQMKIVFRLNYEQTYYDGNVIILMHNYVKSMHERNADDSMRSMRMMREFGAKSRANEVLLRRATAQLVATRDL